MSPSHLAQSPIPEIAEHSSNSVSNELSSCLGPFLSSFLPFLLTPQTIQDLLCSSNFRSILISFLFNVNATLDVQVNEGFGGKNESRGTGRIVVAREDAGIGGAFDAERLDERSPRVDNVMGHNQAMGLNIHYIFIGKLFFGGRYVCIPFASSLQQENIVPLEKNPLRNTKDKLVRSLSLRVAWLSIDHRMFCQENEWCLVHWFLGSL